jgi:hypothetical protein
LDASGKLVDNPVTAADIAGIVVPEAGGAVPGAVDDPGSLRRPSTGYRQVFPQGSFIDRRSRGSDRAGGIGLLALGRCGLPARRRFPS